MPRRPFSPRLRPVAQPYRTIDLDTSYLDDGTGHHRWLLTTCIAGIAATILVGGVTLGIFGPSTTPGDAVAGIAKEQVQPIGQAGENPVKSANLKTAEAPKGETEVLPERELDGEWAYPEITEQELPYTEDTVVLDAEIAPVDDDSENITTISKSAPPEPVDERFQLTKGKTITQELIDRGVSKAAAQSLVESFAKLVPPKSLKAGTEFEVTFDSQYDFYGREVIFPVELSFKPSPGETVIVESDEDGQFLARLEGKRPVVEKPKVADIYHYRSRGKIGSSLYSTAKDNNIPEYIVAEFTRVLSYDVDFQHQVSASDSYEMFFGRPLSGSSSKRKVLHFAKLNFDGKTKTYFRFTTADGQTDYYDENGRSAGRALLKTPISGVKITSGFGMRRHPLLGYSRMHTGVDFGAPPGTPVRSAGSGVIDLAGRHGAYGITVVVKHGEKYKTLYAHLSKLAAGIRKGTKVNQGQVIGYVGSTGRSSGPHLHYEVRVSDRPVNPTGIKATGGKQLAGKDLQNFRLMKQRILAMMQTAPSAVQVAQAGQ